MSGECDICGVWGHTESYHDNEMLTADGGQIEQQVIVNEPTEIKPGQIWIDKRNIWSPGYNGEMVYVVKSKEPSEGWMLICFQEWTFGGYIRGEFNEPEIRKMEYLGHIKDIRRVSE